MADLFDCSADNISLHLKNIFSEEELDEKATTEDFSVVQKEGTRNVIRKVKCYNFYIAEVKRDLGLPMYDALNAVEELKQPRKHPTPVQVNAIKDALEYFRVMC